MSCSKRSRVNGRGVMIRLAKVAAIITLAIAPTTPISASRGKAGDPAARIADLNWLLDHIAAHYAYLSTSGLDLSKLRALYRPEAAAAENRAAWIHVLEDLMGELHDDHATLNTNTPSSPQLIPTGTDIWAEMKDGRAVIMQVRVGSPADAAGLRPGDTIAAINGVPAHAAVTAALPAMLDIRQAGDFTLRRLLAGMHDRVRILTLGDHRRVVLPPYRPPAHDTPLEWRWLSEGIGYIRLNNSLGDADTVAAFDQAAAQLRGAKGLILDLRGTPSGGHTDVAEPILGRLIARAGAYQRMLTPAPGRSVAKDSVLRRVSPRGPFTLAAPLVVLVDRWTGSMGEGMAVGLKALGRATIVGTRMAGLRGGTEEFTLPHTHVTVDLPTYRIYQVNGVPRQNFVPDITVNLRQSATKSTDPILDAGRAQLRSLMGTPNRAVE